MSMQVIGSNIFVGLQSVLNSELFGFLLVEPVRFSAEGGLLVTSACVKGLQKGAAKLDLI